MLSAGVCQPHCAALILSMVRIRVVRQSHCRIASLPFQVSMPWNEMFKRKLPSLHSLKLCKPLTGDQALSHGCIQLRLCQENRRDGGPHSFLYNSSTPSPRKMSPGPDHGGERDLITDPLLAQMMFGSMPMTSPVGSMKLYYIDRT